MTTRDKGITLPIWSNLRFSNGILETSSSVDFSANASYKYTPYGVFPITQIAPQSAIPQDLTIQSQDANPLFAAFGGSIKLVVGAGSVTDSTGNVSIQNSSSTGGDWNTGHLILGIYHIWVDVAGKLRIKNSAPVSSTDGTIVGVQS